MNALLAWLQSLFRDAPRACCVCGAEPRPGRVWPGEDLCGEECLEQWRARQW